MKRIILTGDKSRADCEVDNPQTAIEGEYRATIRGRAIVCEGHRWSGHSDGDDSHTSVHGIASASNITLCGKRVLLDGDLLSCGDHAVASEDRIQYFGK